MNDEGVFCDARVSTGVMDIQGGASQAAFFFFFFMDPVPFPRNVQPK